MTPRPPLTALATVALALAPTPALAAKKKPKAPSRAVVTKLLKQRYTDFAKSDVPAIEKLQVTVGRFRFGRTRVGDAYKDGVPANTKTWVFPVKLQSATYIACNQYFTYKDVYTGGDFVFFRDDFGDWTYRGTDASNASTSLPSCPI